MVLAMFLTTIQNHPSIDTIDHKFLVTSHTHMECDSDHATIERVKKTSDPIELPDDWYRLVQTAGKKKSFDVNVMTQENFYDYDQLFKKSLLLKKKDTHGNTFSFQSVKWLRYTKTFGKVQYKNSL